VISLMIGSSVGCGVVHSMPVGNNDLLGWVLHSTPQHVLCRYISLVLDVRRKFEPPL